MIASKNATNTHAGDKTGDATVICMQSTQESLTNLDMGDEGQASSICCEPEAMHGPECHQTPGRAGHGDEGLQQQWAGDLGEQAPPFARHTQPMDTARAALLRDYI